jgi:hypothetical protein
MGGLKSSGRKPLGRESSYGLPKTGGLSMMSGEKKDRMPDVLDDLLDDMEDKRGIESSKRPNTTSGLGLGLGVKDQMWTAGRDNNAPTTSY